MENKDFNINRLEDILNIPSPTGYTKDILDYIQRELSKINIEYRVSNKGVLLATIKGNDSTKCITFSAHIDTLGAMVSQIKCNTRLSINQIGGYMINSVEGENVIIHTRSGKKYEGTLQTIKPSVHIYGNDARELKRECINYEIVVHEQIHEVEDVYNLGIDVGDIVSFDTRTIVTSSGFIKSRYLDDKASVAVILDVIQDIVANDIKPKYDINFLFSNYEEVGHGASSFIPQNTIEFIAVDMGCPGENQNSSEYDVCICTKDSNGPYDYELINHFIQICKERNINYKLDVYPNYGSDATAALKSGMDAKFALKGPGIFASHGYERTHISSIIETKKLILEYIKYI